MPLKGLPVGPVREVARPGKGGLRRAAAPAVPEDWCPRHRVTMDHHSNTKGEWYSHRLENGDYCKGK